MSTGNCIKRCATNTSASTLSPVHHGRLPRLMTFLLTTAILLLGSATYVPAIPATTSAVVTVGFFAADGGGREQAPPNQPVVDLSLPATLTSGGVTRFVLSTVTAFVNFADADGGISAQGVNQTDTLVSAPNFAPVPAGSANFSLESAGSSQPLAIDFSGLIHRSGARTASFAGTAAFFAESISFDKEVTGDQIGDFPFEFHAVLPPNE
ncbi:MAG TPA: hypothetical protein VKD72_35655, partial [Gemmataceae bacterium]|nr:hypothetical protein [Gemmataceae bacterium]